MLDHKSSTTAVEKVSDLHMATSTATTLQRLRFALVCFGAEAEAEGFL